MNYLEKEPMNENMKEAALFLISCLKNGKPHTIESLCSKLEERYENVNPLVVEKALDSLAKIDARIVKPSAYTYQYVHETFEEALNKSDCVFDNIYRVAQNQLHNFELTIMHETDPALISEVRDHMHAYQKIMSIVDKVRG